MKHSTIRIAGLLAIWAVFSVIAAAQEVTVTASAAPNVLRTGDQFNLTYSANQEITGVELPQMEGVVLLGGPSQGRFQSVSSVNGKVTTNSTYQFTYFMQANREGKLNIPAATVRVKGKSYKTNAVTLEVLAATSQPAKGNGNAGTNAAQAVAPGDDNVMVRLLTDKKEVYLGEQITATVKIYTKVTLAGVDLTFKGPDFTGFFTEPVEVPQLRNLQREAVNGDIYYSGVLRKMVVMPQKTGQLTIKPFDLQVAVRQEVRRRSVDPFFEDFDFPDIQEVPLKLESKSVTIRVNPLPPGAPESFTGGVGSFSFKASLSKNTAVTQEPLTLKLAVTGRGNIKLINEPRLELPPDFEKYDPVINTNQDNGAGGTKTFEYMLVPRVAGDFTIPAVEFTYFDPVARQYRTLRSEAFTVNVSRGSGDTLMAMAPGMAQEDIRLLNRDIRYIKNKGLNLRTHTTYWADSVGYYLLYAITTVLFVLLLVLIRKRARERADTVGLRLRQADRYARKRLVKSEALLKQGDSNRFYEEMLGAVWGYLSDKLKIPLSSLSSETAQTALKSRNVEDELTGELFRIISECEMARYGQLSGNHAMEKLYRETLDVISKIQQKLR